MRKTPSGPSNVYLTGTVLGHLYGTLLIDDPGNDIATAWQDDVLEKHLTTIYDLREGFTRGVMDHAHTDTYIQNGWSAAPQLATLIRADHGPFATWMGTSYADQGNALYARVGPGPITQTAPDGFLQVMVLGVWQTAGQPIAGGGYQWLAVQGNVTAYCGAGKRYEIDGRRHRHFGVQSGTWAADATGTASTTFTLHGYAWLSQYMAGWMLQPDVNHQVYLPITGVHEGSRTVTVAGSYADLGAKGGRFRIHAPPGVDRRNPQAGLLDRFVAAASSRCLFAGYRYESPLAGFENWSSTVPAVMTATHRQQGQNFAGLYYTLHRHYDPVLMRFTSPDPAASPWWNLNGYCGNNPAGAYDPDGLQGLYRGDDGLSPAERLRRLEDAQKNNGGRPVSGIDAQRAIDPAIPTQAEVVHETLKEVNSNATLGITEGANQNTAAGRAVKNNSTALMFLPDATLVLGGLGKFGTLAKWERRTDHVADAYQFTRHTGHLEDFAGGSRLLNRSDDAVDWMRDARRVSGEGLAGGQRLRRTELRQIQRQLAGEGIGLVTNAGLKKGSVGEFNFVTNTILLPKGATRYQFFHEYQHALHLKQLGSVGAYRAVGRYGREAHVFRQIWQQRSSFSRAEVRHALEYLKEVAWKTGVGRPR